MNNITLLQKSLKNLYWQNYKNIEVFVVDNGSIDTTIAALGKKFKKVKVITNKENIGFGKAANMAIRKARGEYIFIHNDDAILTKNTLEILVSKMESDRTLGSIQGTILFTDRKNIVESAGSFLTNLGILEKKEGFKFRKNVQEYEVFSANLPLLRASALKETGLFDEDYFLYFEEADLSWRLWLLGYRVIYCPESILYHGRGSTTKKISKPLVLKSTYKNRIDSLIKNLSLVNLVWILPTNVCVSLFGVIIFILKGRLKESWAIFEGTFSSFFELKKIMAKRNNIQNKRKISDRILFSKVFKFMSPLVLLKGAINYFLAW